MRAIRRLWLAGICAARLGLGAAAPAQGAFDDPLFFATPRPSDKTPVPPSGQLSGPCGLAVSSTGQIYVSDYYHRAVDVFNLVSEVGKPPLEFARQPLSAFSGTPSPHTGPVDDPCGLAFDSTGAIYLNDYHREVVRFPEPVSLSNPNNKVIDTGDPTNAFENPTGVAVDQATNHAFLDDRAYLAERTSSGALVQKIGEGTLIDGYGIAVSGFPATAGFLYVPDAGTETVKVYDPKIDTINPIASLAKPGGFGSLQDSSVAVDNSTGEIYVTDTLGPQLTESPQAIVYVFTAAGSYEGRLKHATVNAAPTGLAVDNSGSATQSRVYVTSGIAENASIYAYPAHAATSAAEGPLSLSGSGGPGGSSGTFTSAAASAQSGGSQASPQAPQQPSAQSDGPAPAGKAAEQKRHRRAARHRTSHRHHGESAQRVKGKRR